MVNIIHTNIHYNDARTITAIEIKLKSFNNGSALTGHPLVATVSTAFFKTTLLTDVGESLKTTINPNRKNVVDLVVTLKKDNDLTALDVANFINALQRALDETSLF